MRSQQQLSNFRWPRLWRQAIRGRHLATPGLKRTFSPHLPSGRSRLPTSMAQIVLGMNTVPRSPSSLCLLAAIALTLVFAAAGARAQDLESCYKAERAQEGGSYGPMGAKTASSMSSAGKTGQLHVNK